jgi:hypothetical protein
MDSENIRFLIGFGILGLVGVVVYFLIVVIGYFVFNLNNPIGSLLSYLAPLAALIPIGFRVLLSLANHKDKIMGGLGF